MAVELLQHLDRDLVSGQCCKRVAGNVHGQLSLDLRRGRDAESEQFIAEPDRRGNATFQREGVIRVREALQVREDEVVRPCLRVLVAFHHGAGLLRHFERNGLLVLVHDVVQSAFAEVRPAELHDVARPHAREVERDQPHVPRHAVRRVGQRRRFELRDVFLRQADFERLRDLDLDLVFAERRMLLVQNAFPDGLGEDRLDGDEKIGDRAVAQAPPRRQIDFELREKGCIDVLKRNVRPAEEARARLVLEGLCLLGPFIAHGFRAENEFLEGPQARRLRPPAVVIARLLQALKKQVGPREEHCVRGRLDLAFDAPGR